MKRNRSGKKGEKKNKEKEIIFGYSNLNNVKK